MVQMMRDEDFEVPLTDPMEATVARVESEAQGFIDHGIRISRKEMAHTEPRRVPPAKARPPVAREPRMYTLDLTLGTRRRGRAGR